MNNLQSCPHTVNKVLVEIPWFDQKLPINYNVFYLLISYMHLKNSDRNEELINII